DVVPAVPVAQRVFEGARLETVLADLDAITGAGDSVSLFTTWQDPQSVNQVWVKSTGEMDGEVIAAAGGRAADGKRHPIPGIDPEPCTPQLGEFGPWFDR